MLLLACFWVLCRVGAGVPGGGGGVGGVGGDRRGGGGWRGGGTTLVGMWGLVSHVAHTSTE